MCSWVSLLPPDPFVVITRMTNVIQWQDMSSDRTFAVFVILTRWYISNLLRLLLLHLLADEFWPPSKGVARHIIPREGELPQQPRAAPFGAERSPCEGLIKVASERKNRSIIKLGEIYPHAHVFLHQVCPAPTCRNAHMHKVVHAHPFVHALPFILITKLLLAEGKSCHICFYSNMQCQIDNTRKESPDPIRYDTTSTLLSVRKSRRAQPFHSRAGLVPPIKSTRGHSLCKIKLPCSKPVK